MSAQPNPDSTAWPTYHIRDNALTVQHMHRHGYVAMNSFHLHEYYEIFYLVKGERIYFINDRVYTAKQGDLVIINPHELHRTTTSPNVQEFERILINFKPELLHSMEWVSGEELLPFAQGSCLLRFSEAEQPEIYRMVQEMLAECRQQRLGYEAFVQANLIKLLVRIRRHEPHQTDQHQPFAHPMHEKISEIAAFLNQHYHEDITLHQVAKQFFISPFYLSRIFKKLTGFQFREYLLAVRVKEAQKQLRESQEKIVTIAHNVGFEHVSHFNTTFKKMIGTTPLKYRKSYSLEHQD
ncbi:helix-turn-helix transcriptional regulator [Paenibacillus cremeus]|uniref:Helix-turn-helix domain-containing protein n=1 Tax=Paenibacillus cremeus TaxID=2163881 RepID=A0A559K4L7_9BACL|nr:AraC family transcriptional regulator [Paenibacillus cremeus]TVY07081.1 helix-turn-helix domain-containing protein [Paenibacillus cremeus]